MFCVHYLASNIFTLSRVYTRVCSSDRVLHHKVGRCTMLNENNKNQKLRPIAKIGKRKSILVVNWLLIYTKHFTSISKEKSCNYDSHKNTHNAKIDHYFISVRAKSFLAKLRIISFIQDNSKSEIRPRLKQPTANTLAIHLQLNGP